mmetsp:Transcript_43975/g.98980  ORF Transcript_43975/g.98980 Transcript_43975/m.98980 type:complete len:253 (-) Transcript_43975:100-858(-)
MAAAWVPNAEGVDLAQPLPFKSKEELKNVELIQMRGSPPCHTIRAFFEFATIPFEVIEVSMVTKSQLKRSKSYKKVPIVFFNEQYQVNDSFIVLKTLSPLVFGRDATQQELDQMTEINKGVMLRMETEMFGTKERISKFLAPVLENAGCSKFILKMVAPSAVAKIPAKILAKNPNLKSLKEYGEEFKGKLSGAFFAGAEPGPADISMYSLIHMMVHLEITDVSDQLLKDGGLGDWYQAVEAKFPKGVAGIFR